MTSYLFSKKAPPSLCKLKGMEVLAPKDLARHSPEAGSLSYLDLSSIAAGDLKKSLGLLKRRCAKAAWGIVDPKGTADPAALFFEGASDYLGPALLKKGIDLKRLKTAAEFRAAFAGEGKAGTAKTGKGPAAEDAEDFVYRGAKLPAGKFGGWSSIRSGTTSSFFFLFVSLNGETSLRSRLGEGSFKTLMGRLRSFLVPRFQEASALLWMETENNFLFLIPPKAEYARAAAEGALKILLGSTAHVAEYLGLPIQAEFTFALHYGKTLYRAPGKTGAVVADAVNFIFHLGTKRAEQGRLTYSDALPPDALGPQLEAMFINTAPFEGRNLRQSLRFAYSR